MTICWSLFQSQLRLFCSITRISPRYWCLISVACKEFPTNADADASKVGLDEKAENKGAIAKAFAMKPAIKEHFEGMGA